MKPANSLSSTRAHVRKSGSKAMPVVGLKELGNTSFFNSVIQCLANIPPLREYFLSGEYKEHIVSTTQNPLGSGGAVAEAWSRLLAELSTATRPVGPSGFRQALGDRYPMFTNRRPGDSCEALQKILDVLHEDLNLAKKSSDWKESCDWDDESDDYVESANVWKRSQRRNRSKIVDLFHGMYRGRMRYESGDSGTRFELFNILQLSLPDNVCKLTDCLTAFGKVRRHDAEWNPKRKLQERVNTKFDVWQLPNVLVIQLNRGVLDHATGQWEKITKTIQFDEKLSMSQFVKNDEILKNKWNTRYRLTGVISHVGSASDGHNYAHVKSAKNGKWYLADDSEVEECEFKDVMTNNAYMLFYMRDITKCSASEAWEKLDQKVEAAGREMRHRERRALVGARSGNAVPAPRVKFARYCPLLSKK